MAEAPECNLGKIQFITGSLKGLLKIASEERCEMLKYLIEMALKESEAIEEQLGGRKP